MADGNFLAKFIRKIFASGENDDAKDEANRALDNSLVLEAILDNLKSDVTALQSFRLVKKEWKNVSLGLWRSSATLRVHPYSKSGPVYHVGRDGLNFDQLFITSKSNGTVEILPDLQEKPFQRHVILDEVSFPPNIFLGSYEGHYWENYGPHLRFLHLPQAYFYRGNEIQGLEWIFEHCPNLKELLMAGYRKKDGESVENPSQIPSLPKIKSNLETFHQTHVYLPGSTSEMLFSQSVSICQSFLQMTPKLKTLIIDGEPKPFLEALGAQKGDTVVKLHTLEIPNKDLNSGLLQILADYFDYSNSQLKSLKINIDGMRTQKEHGQSTPFRRIMGVNEQSLKKLALKVRLWDGNKMSPTCFNNLNDFHFNNLVELSIEFRYNYFQESDYIPFDFQTLKNTPKLKRFCCSYSGYEMQKWLKLKLSVDNVKGGQGWELSSSSGEELENALNLEYLEEFQFYRDFDTEALVVLSKWMPGIRKLRLPSCNYKKDSNLRKLWGKLESNYVQPTE